MKQDALEKRILLDAGLAVGEVVLAITAIVQALKKQPGFDVSNFDKVLEKALPEVSKKYDLTADILRACLSIKDS